MQTTADLTRVEETVDTGLEYLPGVPVLLRVVTRGRRVAVSDEGRAVELAGRPAGWREVAARIANQLIVNVSRHGTIGLPVSGCGPGHDAIVSRIAAASLAVYEDLLDLE